MISVAVGAGEGVPRPNRQPERRSRASRDLTGLPNLSGLVSRVLPLSRFIVDKLQCKSDHTFFHYTLASERVQASKETRNAVSARHRISKVPDIAVPLIPAVTQYKGEGTYGIEHLFYSYRPILSRGETQRNPFSVRKCNGQHHLEH
jgi:hypothetical protein